MATSGSEPAFVILIVRDGTIPPRCKLMATAVLSTAMNGVGGGPMVNGAEVAINVPAVKLKTRGPALPLTRRSAKVATPPTEATLSVPPSVPPPVVIVAVMRTDGDVTILPAASCTSTAGCVVNGTPTIAPAGCVRIASCRTDPGVTVTATFAVAEPLVAVMVALPTFTAVSCGPDITATAGLELVHVIDGLVIVCPSFAVADAVNTVTVPDVSVSSDAGAIVIEATVLSGEVVPEGPESPPQPTAVNANPRIIIERGAYTGVGERWERLDDCRRRQAGKTERVKA
jgi:hypothetical protein